MPPLRPSQFEAIWKNAIIHYKEISGKDLNELNLGELRNVVDLEKAISQKSAEFTEFREKRHTLFKVMRNAMLPIELVGDIASGGASLVFAPSSVIFGSVVYLIDAAKSVSRAYDAIEELMSSLQDFTVRLKIYERESISPELQMKLAETLTTLLDIFAYSRKVIKKRGRLLGFGRNLLLGSDADIGGAVGRLSKLTASEDRIVGAETLIESKKTGRIVNTMSTTVTSTQAMVEQLRRDNREYQQTSLEQFKNVISAVNDTRTETPDEKAKNHEDKMKRVLQPSNFPQDLFDRITKARVPGTGHWFQDEQLFKSWLAGSISVLWVSGIPGAGKSFLSASIISFLNEHYPQGVQDSSHISVAYFFFKDTNPETQSFHQAMCDASYQIGQNDPVYAKFVAATCDSTNEIRSLEAVWRKLFVDFFIKNSKVDSRVYLIFDGIDEADDSERNIFFTLLKDIDTNTEASSRIQLMMIGRPHLTDEISYALERDAPTVDVTEVKNSEDIINYIQNSIRRSRVLKRVKKELQENVINTLSARASGMFLWVDLMIRELNSKSRESQIREALNKAPRGLNRMLRHVLESFSRSLLPEEIDDLNELLSWVTCAKRPLKLGELDTILKLKSPTGDGMIYLEGRLRRQYASFFALNRDDGLSTADLVKGLHLEDSDIKYLDSDEELDVDTAEVDFDSNPDTTEVTFCHASIGDFFRNQLEGKTAVDNFPPVGVDYEAAKFHILKTCIQFFCNESYDEMEYEAPLFSYASTYWAAHMRDVQVSAVELDERKALGKLIVKMCRDETVIERWAAGMNWLFWRTNNIDSVRQWLDDTEVFNSLSPLDQEWIKSTAGHPGDIFLNYAKLCARIWLHESRWITYTCFWIVHAAVEFLEGHPLSDDPKHITTPAEVLKVAEWAGLEKTANWHRRVAIVLRECELYDAALKHFKKAIKMDPDMELAKSGAALTYKWQGRYEKAIKLEKEAERKLLLRLDANKDDDNARVLLGKSQQNLSECYKLNGDYEIAYQYGLKAFKSDNSLYENFGVCVFSLAKRARSREIIDLLKVMEKPVPGEKRSPLMDYFIEKAEYIDFFRVIANSSVITGELKYIRDILRAAVNIAREEKLTLVVVQLEYFLARFYYRYLQDIDRAIFIWERIVATTGSAKTQPSLNYVCKSSAMRLTTHHLERALELKEGPEYSKHVREIVRLGQHQRRPGKNASTSYAALNLSLWYRLNGRLEESRDYAKAHVKEALQILSDDDPYNDDDGWTSLAQALLFAGDDENALAIWQTLFADRKTTEKKTTDQEKKSQDQEAKDILQENSKTTTGDDLDDASSIDEDSSVDQRRDYYFCDGICMNPTEMDRHDNIHFCRYCIYVDFCDDCLKLVQEDKLPLRVCSSKHSWLTVKPLGKIVPEGKICVGEELVDVETWKEELKKEWHIL